jgi:hypothetical protein
MKFEEWLATVPIKQTPKGARLDLRVYVYPDGHGNFYPADETGRHSPEGQPVNNPTEARDVLEKIWTHAMNIEREPSTEDPPKPTLAEQFADLIGTVPDLPGDMAAQHDHYLHGAPKS